MWRTLGAWFVMLIVAVANGAVRDFTYGKRIGELAAHQVSTLTGVVMLGIVMWVFVRLYPLSSAWQAGRLGLLWMGMTVAFEFLLTPSVHEATLVRTHRQAGATTRSQYALSSQHTVL